MLEPFPDDAPRALQEKALQIYAVANINERTRKQDKLIIDIIRMSIILTDFSILVLYRHVFD
jgi:hypothetical protein